MQVIDAKHDRWGELVLLVDQIPKLETLRFQKLRIEGHNRGHLYVAEQDGYVRFFFQDDPDQPGYGQGYHGQDFPIRLVDGTAETLVGPFSSNTDAVNHYLPKVAAHPAGLTTERRDFESGMATVVGAITGDLYRQVIQARAPSIPLPWLRQRYEAVEAQLSAMRPPPGKGPIEDGTAHRQWIIDNLRAFAEQAQLLRAIATRSAAIRATAHDQVDTTTAALTEILPSLRQVDAIVPATLLEKVAVYHASYGEPGQTVLDVLSAAVAPGTTRYRELASIANDLGVVLEATADADQALYRLWSLDVELAPDPEPAAPEGAPSSYQEYVAHGVFAPYGRRTGGLASSLDDRYVGLFGDDWGDGPPSYEIGPSGTDEEHYAELAQYQLWRTARALRVLEASGHKAIPHGAARVDVDRFLTTAFGPWLLDRDDPAIRAAAALQNPDLAAALFNTPDTQWVLGLGRDELQRLGLGGGLAIGPVREAGGPPAREPWVPGEVAPLLAPRPGLVSAEVAAQARAASTPELLAWVQQAQLPQPTPPERPHHYGAREAAEALRRHRDEEQLVLDGLRRELGQTGSRRRRRNRERRADLEGRIAERALVLQRLDAEVQTANAELDRIARQQRAVGEMWDVSHGAVVVRGVAAVQELQQREDQLLDGYLSDPPQHLLDAIGPAPTDPAGQQAWREQARQVERHRTTEAALDQATLSIMGRGNDRSVDGQPEIGEEDLGDSWRTYKERADHIRRTYGWTTPEPPPPGGGNWLELGERDEGPTIDLAP
jgi:hypothetical protein